MRDSVHLVEELAKLIGRIDADESKSQIIQEWSNRVARHHPPEAFDKIIATVANDLGREYLDVVRLRNRFYDRWKQELESRKSGYDFEVEARKLVEHALLNVMTPVLPITGADILESFSVEPGPKIGELLRHARMIYESEPCAKQELLDKLRHSTRAMKP
jgi:isoleucyl-tRNA synthetase